MNLCRPCPRTASIALALAGNNRRFGQKPRKGPETADNDPMRSASARRAQRDDADRAAYQLGPRAGDLDIAQRLPVLDEARRPARQHVARLAERDGEAAVVEVAEVVDPAIARAMHRLE